MMLIFVSPSLPPSLAAAFACRGLRVRRSKHQRMSRSLTHLAGAQLKASRNAVDPADVPRFFGSAQDIVQLALHTANDAGLVQR